MTFDPDSFEGRVMENFGILMERTSCLQEHDKRLKSLETSRDQIKGIGIIGAILGTLATIISGFVGFVHFVRGK